MSVTDNLPTKVGQRVQDIFTDSRGWVTYLNENGEALVDWDEKPVGDEDAVFPLDALRVVEIIRVDMDHFADPGRSPLVEQVSHPEGTGVDQFNIDRSRTRYKFVDGSVAVGVNAARDELLKQSASGWDED